MKGEMQSLESGNLHIAGLPLIQKQSDGKDDT